jgi:sugar phosphate isomerase/epimerase
MPDVARLSLNLATVRKQWDLLQAMEGVARAGIPAIAPWRDQIAAVGLAPAVQRFRDLGLQCSGLCRGGMFPAETLAGRRAAMDDNLRALEEAVAFGAACLVLVVGGMPPGSRDLAGARQQVEDGIAELLTHAQKAGMPLAIEPLHPMYAADRACVNTMAQALDICDRLGPGVGVACDVYHVWWDPDLFAQIARCGKERLLAFHICDWLRETKDLLLDRGMMGDGVIDIPLIRSWVEGQGFAGYHEVEIFSAANWWTRDPEEVLATCIERHCSVC